MDTKIYRYVVGFEKAGLDNRASFTLHVPYFSLNPSVANNVSSAFSPLSSSIGSDDDSANDIGDITWANAHRAEVVRFIKSLMEATRWVYDPANDALLLDLTRELTQAEGQY